MAEMLGFCPVISRSGPEKPLYGTKNRSQSPWNRPIWGAAREFDFRDEFAADELRFPPPADPQPYQDAFKCPLRFNAPVNALLFARADITLPLPTAHPELAEMHER